MSELGNIPDAPAASDPNPQIPAPEESGPFPADGPSGDAPAPDAPEPAPDAPAPAPDAPEPAADAPAPVADAPAPASDTPAPPPAPRPRRVEATVAELETVVRGSKRPASYVERIHREADRVRTTAAPEEAPALLERLAALEAFAHERQQEQVARKTALCEQAEALRESVDWKATKERYEALLADWKTIGSVGREQDQALWERFQAAKDVFFKRRSEDLTRRAATRHEAEVKKEDLCARAEALAASEEWKQATQDFATLMEDWKAAGSAGREVDQALWLRFGAARSAFFERRGAHHKKLRHEHEENRARKDALCGAAEALAGAEDLAAACDRVKELQAEWKTIGPAPREVHQHLWERFRAACNAVFEQARGEREARQASWLQNLADAKGRKEEQALNLRESIARDQGHVERWRAVIANLREDWRSGDVKESLEAKIADVEERLKLKTARLLDLESTLARIDAKLARRR